ncbi:MAG: hypothetical protein QG646_1866 [Euryarchaeota archaeon]|nr:hypothetical protein [Euryarchaeota archaeon]
MNITKISENIGWDGTHFSCRRCGKSGYDRMAQVRGHLAMCRGKAIQKGAIPKQDSQPVATALKANFKGLPTGWQPVAVAPSNNQSVDDRLARLETKVDNEIQHMLVDRNQNNTINGLSAWFEANKGMILLVGGSFLLVLLLRDSKCHCDCDTPQSYTRSTRNGRRDNSSLNSMLGTAGTYLFKKGVDKVLK